MMKRRVQTNNIEEVIEANIKAGRRAIFEKMKEQYPDFTEERMDELFAQIASNPLRLKSLLKRNETDKL